jgi:hypothetical protein|tara:strand:- start:198 stop:665 length:468 start_codon:yes stop_codon:yes gene_type:complete
MGSLYNTGASILSGVQDAVGYENDDYDKALKEAEEEFYAQSELDGMSGEDEFDEEAFKENYRAKSMKDKAKESARTVGKYKEPVQKGTPVARTSKRRTDENPRGKGYGRGSDPREYTQERRGLTSGELEKLLLETMHSNAKMSVFQNALGGKRLI